MDTNPIPKVFTEIAIPAKKLIIHDRDFPRQKRFIEKRSTAMVT